MKNITSRQYIETRTADGELVRLWAASEAATEVRTMIQEKIAHLCPAAEHQTSVQHGGYSLPSCYQITQHKYGASMHSYIEVLEILDPPEGYWPIVFNDFRPENGTVFFEFETVDAAIAAFNHVFNRVDNAKLSELPGFKRRVNCGRVLPWFYAIGNQELIGDYAAPYDMQDDPVYRMNRQFVVTDEHGLPSIKTCMGTRLGTRRDPFSGGMRDVSIVYWSDGTTSHDRYANPPRPIDEGEAWIAEAMAQFQRVLSGHETSFSIKFMDGSEFVGQRRTPKRQPPTAEGKYWVIARLKGEKKAREGLVTFTPTPETSDLRSFVIKGLQEKYRKDVETMKIKKTEHAKLGKKWSGVLFPSPQIKTAAE